MLHLCESQTAALVNNDAEIADGTECSHLFLDVLSDVLNLCVSPPHPVEIT